MMKTVDFVLHVPQGKAHSANKMKAVVHYKNLKVEEKAKTLLING